DCKGAGANFCPAPDRRSGWPLANSFDPAGEAPDPLLGPDLKNGATTVILPSCGSCCQLRKCRCTRISSLSEPSSARTARDSADSRPALTSDYGRSNIAKREDFLPHSLALGRVICIACGANVTSFCADTRLSASCTSTL